MKAVHLTVRLICVMLLIITFSCNDVDENNPVTTPASKFVGKWKTETPVLIKIKTDFCTNVLEDVATMMWDVSWVVTETNDPNIVNITMHYTSSDYTVINSACDFGTGYLPEPQPMYLKGYIDGNNISIEYLDEEIFSLDYENVELTGTLSYSYCFGFCQEIYTDERNFQVTFYK